MPPPLTNRVNRKLMLVRKGLRRRGYTPDVPPACVLQPGVHGDHQVVTQHAARNIPGTISSVYLDP